MVAPPSPKKSSSSSASRKRSKSMKLDEGVDSLGSLWIIWKSFGGFEGLGCAELLT